MFETRTESKLYVLLGSNRPEPMGKGRLGIKTGDFALRRMEDKGLVRCEVKGRTRHYFPAVEREGAALRETRSFLNKVYRGSVGLMVSAMAQDKALTKAEIEELYDILKQAEEGAK